MVFSFSSSNPGRTSTPLVVLLCWVVAAPLYGQSVGEPAGTASSLDERLLLNVYTIESPAFRGVMRAADASAYPVFLGAPVAAWGGAWLIRDDGDFTDAYRLTLSQAVTTVAVIGLKRLIRRPRPYAALPGITARTSDATFRRLLFDALRPRLDGPLRWQPRGASRTTSGTWWCRALCGREAWR